MARVQPVFPKLVDPSGVNCSNKPRDIGITTDETRAYNVKTTEGQPEAQFGGTSNPYVDYQFIDLLHTMQAPRSQAYDETYFYLIGQVKELLFNALHFELFNARHQILHAPSPYDRTIALLARRGCAVDAQALQRDWSLPYKPNESVEQAWLKIYQQAKTDNVLYELDEALITLDDHISQYRWRHFTSVSRIIGHKPGTGGSAGLGWLRYVTEHRFFPELWSLRTSL